MKTGVLVVDEDFVKRLNESRLLLPPLADYTDYPFRTVLAEFNPPFMCTEMVSPEALLRGNMKTADMLKMVHGKHMNGAQLVGSNPESMGKAASMIEEMGYDYIDINMGCTVNAIANTGAGISLMGDEQRAVDVVSSVVDAVGIPVTCKIRLGVSEGNKNAVKLTSMLEDTDISVVTVHGRTGEYKFGVNVDYDGIKAVVEKVEIPVIANGSVYSGSDALEMIEKTGAQGVMPGRGLIGNPWIVPDIRHVFNNTEFERPSLEERKQVFITHLEFLCEFYGERTGVVKSRKIIGKYFAGSVNIGRLKLQSNKTGSKAQMRARLDGLTVIEGRVFYQG
jgi:tRNA-dihydrouridine synthase B